MRLRSRTSASLRDAPAPAADARRGPTSSNGVADPAGQPVRAIDNFAGGPPRPPQAPARHHYAIQFVKWTHGVCMERSLLRGAEIPDLHFFSCRRIDRDGTAG